MRASLNFDFRSLKDFENKCEAIISKVGSGSRKAAVEACRIISEDSLNQVPRDTETLALSQFWEVTGHYKTGWIGTVGYGGNGDPINPRTGQRASQYMVVVHEDMSAIHLIGKAKFLEDPIRAFAKERFPRTVFNHVQNALDV